jgi:hypothetical protein
VSDDEPRDGAPTRRHHPKFDSRCPANRDRLQKQSRSIQEEMGRIKYHGEQAYRTPAQNALASRMVNDELTPPPPTYQKTIKKLLEGPEKMTRGEVNESQSKFLVGTWPMSQIGSNALLF